MTGRLRRTAHLAVATLVTVALVAGCGGSSVEDAGSASQSSTQSDAATGGAAGSAAEPGSVDTGAGTQAGTGAGTTGGTTTSGGSTGTAGGAASKNAAGSGGAAGASASKGSQPAGGQQGSSATSGSASVNGTAAVAKVVQTAPIFGGTAACRPATLSEVPVGNVSTLSGVLGELFSPVVSALNVFVASQNACGGLNGHRIKYYQDDDQGDPSTAITKVQDMIQNKKILAFVGNIQVLTVDAIAPIIKRTGIPIIGSDLTSNTWMSNPLMFPQGSPLQAVGYGFGYATKNYFNKTKLGTMYCIEVPKACADFNRSAKELAPARGVTFVKDIQVSLTAPSYVQECLDMKNAGVEVLGLLIDSASQNRIARSCIQVDYHPNMLTAPISVGNERQFLTGKSWLGNDYVPMNTFPWMANDTPALKYWQASVAKFSPGMAEGGAASLGWASGALLVAASAGLSETNPTTQQLLDSLWTFKGQKFTELGGLAGPRTFAKDQNPRVPYCLYTAISNDQGTGWKSWSSKAVCTNELAPSDPQSQA